MTLWSVAAYLLLPYVLLSLIWRGLRYPPYWYRWAERFGFVEPLPGQDIVWVHAVSVGEVRSSAALIRALGQKFPEYRVLVTTMTPTGSDQVHELFGDRVMHCYAPYDFPDAVQRFLNRVKPRFAVIAETERVRAELGYPIMVTPFPQMVMTQALFNVIGERRYGQVSDQILRYVMGKFGRPTKPVNTDVEQAILDRPRAREIAGEPSFPACADLRRQFGADMDDEEFLFRAVMPPEQVDAMLATGRSRGSYTPEAAPILSLLKQLAARPDAPDIAVERRGFRLALHRGADLGR